MISRRVPAPNAGDVEAASDLRSPPPVGASSPPSFLSSVASRRRFLWALGVSATLIFFYLLYLSSMGTLFPPPHEVFRHHSRCTDKRATVLDVMQCTHDVFEEHGVTYFLDYGSLLGATRHKVGSPTLPTSVQTRPHHVVAGVHPVG
jgi:hypothetical protein